MAPEIEQSLLNEFKRVQSYVQTQVMDAFKRDKFVLNIYQEGLLKGVPNRLVYGEFHADDIARISQLYIDTFGKRSKLYIEVSKLDEEESNQQSLFQS